MTEDHVSFKERIQELERQIADLEARLPAHSVPPAMIAQLEALEETLERLKSVQQPSELNTPGQQTESRQDDVTREP